MSTINLQVSSTQNETRSKPSIAWRNLSYNVRNMWGTKKSILQSLSGQFAPGTLNGLLGPSGAGKSTLLNVLSGSVNTRENTSELYLNSAPGEPIVSYYIRQHVHESIPGQLTVGQILQYAYQFKNRTVGIGVNEKMRKHIEQTMSQLMLPPDLLNRFFSQCSGGEQKRVAVAQELMCATKVPSFIFLDEPTTGLDSSSAHQCMLCLKNLAKSQQITIIASIHSPNDETLNLFDQLYVLAKGGVCVYSGPPNEIKETLESKLGIQVAHQQPPIENLLKIACQGAQDEFVMALTKRCTRKIKPIRKFPNLFRHPNQFPQPRQFFSFVHLYLQIVRLFRLLILSNGKQISFFYLLFIIIFTIFSTIYNHQMATANVCYPKANETQEGSVVTCSNDYEQNQLANMNNTFHGYTVLMVGFLSMCTSAIVFSPLVKMFENEHSNQWYSLLVFVGSTSIVEFFKITVTAVWIATLGYFFTFQHSADEYSFNIFRFSMYLLFIWLLCIYTQSIGQLIGALFMNSTEMSIIVCQIAYIFITLMNGFFVDTDKTGNVVFIHVANVVAMKYITRGLVYTFFGIGRCNFETEFSSFLLRYHVEESAITEYILRILINVVIFRLVTMLFLYVKFNTFSDHFLMRLLRKNTSKTPIPVAFEFSADTVSINLSDNGSQTQLQIKPQSFEIQKSQEEIDFINFVNKKVLIYWRNLSLYKSGSIFETTSSSSAANRKPILNQINGQFKFNTLNGLMGASGAGKTSLLRVLNGQCKMRLSEETAIYVSSLTPISSCFITQEVEFHLMLGLTAKQLLMYASKLKNCFHSGPVNHESIALKWLQELDLLATVDTKVEHCSGGEQKRLAVAIELTAIDMPNLICIDEPTSGLDSNSAEIVISTLRKLTHAHALTIITSIHQPTTEMLYNFDQLYVLARGGVCIYSGLPGQIGAHIESCVSASTVEKIALSQYPIETLIRYSSSDFSTPLVQQLFQLATKSILNEELKSDFAQIASDGLLPNRPRFSFLSSVILARRYLSHVIGHQWPLLLTFAIVNLIYGHQLTIFFHAHIAQPNGCVSLDDDFNSTCSRSAEKILNDFELIENYKYNYFMVGIFLFLLMLQTSLTFMKDFALMQNEHRNGTYSSGAWYMMKCTIEIIPVIFIIMIYVLIVDIYSPILPGIYWPLVGVLILGALATQGLGHIFSLLSDGNITKLTVFTVSAFIFLCHISNFFIPLSGLHYVYQFASNLSISRFVFEAALILQYGFGRCEPKQLQLILYSMSIDTSHFYHSIIMLVVNFFLYRLIAIYLLVRKANPLHNRKTRIARIEKYQHLITGKNVNIF